MCLSVMLCVYYLSCFYSVGNKTTHGKGIEVHSKGQCGVCFIIILLTICIWGFNYHKVNEENLTEPENSVSFHSTKKLFHNIHYPAHYSV